MGRVAAVVVVVLEGGGGSVSNLICTLDDNCCRGSGCDTGMLWWMRRWLLVSWLLEYCKTHSVTLSASFKTPS